MDADRMFELGRRLLRRTCRMLPTGVGITILVHRQDLAEGLDLAIVTTLPSRQQQRAICTQGLWMSGLADSADDPVALALADLAQFEK